jgi:hypothetical protein
MESSNKPTPEIKMTGTIAIVRTGISWESGLAQNIAVNSSMSMVYENRLFFKY